MFTCVKFKTLLASSLFAYIFSAGVASAQCERFPKIALWKNLTHESVKKYVERKLAGDWRPYISHLEQQLKNTSEIIAAGSGARLKHNGEVITLKGDRLVQYYKLSEARLKVARCLSEEKDISLLNDFTVAAGDELAVTEIPVPSLAGGAAATALQIDVSTKCTGGESLFKISNRGVDWPKSGTFSVFRIDGQSKYPVSSRRMRLKHGQVVTFAIQKTRNPTGTLGLFVGPAWYQRPFAYDATLVCR